MAGEIPTIEQLEKDIVEKPQKDSEETVKKWYEGLREKIRTGKHDDAERKRLNDELDAVRERILEVARSEKDTREKKLADMRESVKAIHEEARKGYESLLTEKQKNFAAARKNAHDKTAPGDGFIPDYEGWSMTGEGLTDENANNKTRWTLSGYLTALQMEDKSTAEQQAARAKELYDKSDEGFWNAGKAFEYKHLQEDMGLQKYMQPLESHAKAGGYELAGESMGFLCGLMRIAELKYPADAESYNKYIFGMLDQLKDKLKYEPAGEKDYLADFNRAVKQMPALLEIKTPAEWAEKETADKSKLEDLRKDFEKLKKDALTISEGLKFNYGDAKVRTLLALEASEIKVDDEKAIKSAKEAIHTEAFLKIEQAYKGVYPSIGELETRIGEIEKKNAASKMLAENEVTDVKTRLASAKESYDSIELDKKDPIDVLAQISGIIVNVRNENETLTRKMDEMAEALKKAPAGATGGGGKEGTGGETPGTSGPDAYLDNWENGEAVTGRFKTQNVRISPSITSTVGRNDKGQIYAPNMPGGMVLKLMEVPSRGRKVNGVVFVRVVAGIVPDERMDYMRRENLGVWVDEGLLEAVGGEAENTEKTPESAEINEFLTAKNLKAVPHGGSVWYQLGDFKSVPLAPGSQVSSSGNHEVDSLFLQNYVFRKMSAEEAAKVNRLFQEARFASQFSAVGGVKSLSQLKGMYDNYFTKVWEYAGKNGKVPGSLGEIGIAGGKAPASRDVGRNYGAEVPAELAEFAKERPVNAEVREALVRMARDGEKPEGATFDIRFNKKILPCRLTKMGANNYVINWEGGSQAYRSLKEAMIAVNDGQLVYGLTLSALRNPSYYKAYESWSGKLKEKRLGGTGKSGEVQFELDWLGTRRAKGNPVVVATPYKYGVIGYRIFRSEAGLHGESWREGFAANVEDLMRQLGHIRRWAQEEDYDKGPFAYAKEYNFSILSDPRHYYAAEAMIGRPISIGLTSYDRKAEGKRGDDSEAATASYGKEMVQLGLDWGGSGPADKRNNGWVNLWVNDAGTLSYTVACAGRGIRTEEKRVTTMAEIFRDLAELRKTGGAAKPADIPKTATATVENQPTPEVRIRVMGAGNSETRETAEAKEYEQFLINKNLEEVHQGTSYTYEIGKPRLTARKGKLALRFGNEDLAGFEEKFHSYMNSVLERALPKKELDEIRAMLADTKIEDPAEGRTAMKNALFALLGKLEANMKQEDVERLGKVFLLVVQAVTESEIKFENGKPSFAELRNAYDTVFVPRWKKAETELDAIIGA
jgi:hypothetical protein